MSIASESLSLSASGGSLEGHDFLPDYAYSVCYLRSVGIRRMSVRNSLFTDSESGK